jgi:hypothetical protein
MARRLIFIILLVIPSVIRAQKADTLKPRITREWTLSKDYAEEVNIPIDTTFSLFYRSRQTDKYSSFNAYPGNYGLPLYQINFFDRITDPDMFLYRYYYPFMHLTVNPVFTNTQVPFTEMIFTYAGPTDRAEQTFRISHSQNINRFLNFGLIYDVVYSLGQYNYQKSDNKTFTLYTSYTGEKYKLYLSGGVNNLTSYENGGIVDSSQMLTFDTRDIQLKLGKLNSAMSQLQNRNILLVQRYTLNKKPKTVNDTISTVPKAKGFRLNGTFSHVMTAEINKKEYTDNFPASGFYNKSFIDTTKTFDSLSVRSFKNTIRFDFSTDETRKFRLGGGIGIRNELFRYYQIVKSFTKIPIHSIPARDTVAWNEANNVLVGRLFNDIGNKFRWIASGELFLTGYRAGDFDLEGKLAKTFEWKKGKASWNIFGEMTNFQPSFWYERWAGNNFVWLNNFQKEFRINVGTEFLYPARRAGIKFNYAIINNYTDFGPGAIPSQFSGGLSVVALSLKKEVSVWKFHLSNDVLLQMSSNKNVLDLPSVTIRSAGYFEHNFHFKMTNGSLNTQLGAEAFYNTAYYGYAYMPATGAYFRQEKSLTGNYPYLNAFLNVKLKRTRIFIMFDHLNAGMTGYNYFLVPSYPMNIRMFRYGFAWTFYD